MGKFLQVFEFFCLPYHKGWENVRQNSTFYQYLHQEVFENLSFLVCKLVAKTLCLCQDTDVNKFPTL